QQDERCGHMFAAMRALMAEHSSAVVRNLSASRSTGGGGVALKGKSEEEPGLARRLLAHLGRPLNAEESKYIRKVSATYQRVRWRAAKPTCESSWAKPMLRCNGCGQGRKLSRR